LISQPSANIAIQRTGLSLLPLGLDRVDMEQASDDAGRGHLSIPHQPALDRETDHQFGRSAQTSFWRMMEDVLVIV
jgi:hypothetical protein